MNGQAPRESALSSKRSCFRRSKPIAFIHGRSGIQSESLFLCRVTTCLDRLKLYIQLGILCKIIGFGTRKPYAFFEIYSVYSKRRCATYHSITGCVCAPVIEVCISRNPPLKRADNTDCWNVCLSAQPNAVDIRFVSAGRTMIRSPEFQIQVSVSCPVKTYSKSFFASAKRHRGGSNPGSSTVGRCI